MVSFVWIKHFLNINMFRPKILILPKFPFLAEMVSKKVLTRTSTRMPSDSFCVLWFSSAVEWTFIEPHSFICPTIKTHSYFKHVVKRTVPLGQAAQSRECGTGIPLCTHPTPSPATPREASAPIRSKDKVPPSGAVCNFSSPAAAGMAPTERYLHFSFSAL